MPGGGGAPPGTPSAKLKVYIPLIEPSLPSPLQACEKVFKQETCNFQEKPRSKVVVALYSFRAVESGDLSLEKVSRYLCIFSILKSISFSALHVWIFHQVTFNKGHPDNIIKRKMHLIYLKPFVTL